MQHAIQYGRDADRARLVASVKRHLVARAARELEVPPTLRSSADPSNAADPSKFRRTLDRRAQGS